MTSDESRQARSGYLRAGDGAPEFEFVDLLGETIRSTELLQRGAIILTFYRGAWCTCCQSDLRDLTITAPSLRKAGCNILGVFHNMSPEANRRITNEYELDFPLVDDFDGRAAQSFGIRRSLDEYAKIENELGPELLALREGEPWILPMQARFVIAPSGVIVKSDVIFDYEERSSVRGLMPLVEGRG